MKVCIRKEIKKNKNRIKHAMNLLRRLYTPKVIRKHENIISTNSLADIPNGAFGINAYATEVYNNREAIVTIVSDDGEYETGKNLNELFEAYDFKCTVSGAVRVINPFLKGWKNILEQGNIDLVNHSFNHIGMDNNTEISNDINALTHEIIDSNWYFENYFDIFPITFVCPEGVMCQKGYEIIKECGYYAVRGGIRGYNSLSPEYGANPGNWLNLKCQGIRDNDVDAKVRNIWIDEAIQNRCWLIEMWHNVHKDFDDEGYQTILFKDGKQHLDYINEKYTKGDIWVASFTEATKYIYERQNAQIVAYSYDNKLYVGATLTNKKMDCRIFNHPLSIILDLSVINVSRKVMLNIVPNGIMNEYDISEMK